MVQRFIQWENAILWMAAFAIVWGCGAAPLMVTPIDSTADPAALIIDLGKALTEARAEQVDVLSPTWFAKAQEAYADAAKGQEKAAAPADILENVALGRAQLEQARVVAIRCRDQLDETILSRTTALAANAQQFGADFIDAESDFSKLAQAMEEGDFKYARENRKAVSESFRALELRAITQAALGDARQLLRQVEQTNAPKIAPQACAQAQSELTKVEAFIAEHRYNREMIRQNADQALFMTRRALAMADAGRHIQAMTPEQIALGNEAQNSAISTLLKIADRRDLTLQAQHEANLASLAGLQTEHAAAKKNIVEKEAMVKYLNDRLSELEGTSQRVRYDKERLAAEKSFNELFVSVQSDFKPEEAEVYKQLDTLVVRLKGIQFPPGLAEIQPNSFPLLTKVQKVIRTFGQPEVVIEGHTDNVGSVQKNEAISLSRAQAVKQYLVTNGTLPSKKISAVGYGFTRPIAANETPEGRAQNRRIDLIIKPRIKEMK